MKTWAKVGIGCLIALVLACIVTAAVMFLGGNWLRHKLKGFSSIGQSTAVMQQLNAKYPFTPPADGEVSESRLQVYIAVCTEAKPAVDSYESWIEDHEGKHHGNLSDAKEVISRMGTAMKALGKALKSHKMSPNECAWIERAMDSAANEQQSKALTEGQQQMIKVLEAQVNDPGTSPDVRKNLQKQIDQLKGETASAGTEALSHNAQLYKRYADQIKTCRLGIFGKALLGGSAMPPATH